MIEARKETGLASVRRQALEGRSPLAEAA